MTTVKLKIVEAVGIALIAPLLFASLNAITGTGVHVTEFEVGAIVGVVLMRLMDAIYERLK